MDEALIHREQTNFTEVRTLFIPPRIEIWWAILVVLVASEAFFAFLAIRAIEGGIFNDNNIYIPRTKYPIPLPGWGIGVIVVIFALAGPIACFVPLRWIYQKRPNLTLTGDGILFNALSETHFWRWTEVGTFRLSIRAERRPQYWAYASFRADRAAAAAPAPGTDPATEVTIYLNFLRCGRNEEEARKLVALLNDWREHVQGRLHQNTDGQSGSQRIL